MDFTLLHLYPEAMSLYGEYANLSVLSRLLEDLGAEVTLRTVAGGEVPDFSGADLIYMGAGTERTQKAALSWLMPHQKALRQAEEEGALVFFTGNAMELLGTAITDKEGKRFEGLGFASFTTTETDKRVPHDIIARTDFLDTPLVGFMNKCSVTAGAAHPLCSAMDLGAGNEAEGGPEGFFHGNLLATHITGPVLVKNPAFLLFVAKRLYEAKGEAMPPLPAGRPWLDRAERAYQVTLTELSAQIKGT